MKLNAVLLSMLVLLLAGCSSNEKKDEEYQFSTGLKLLDMPPDLTHPDKNLVMEIPKPSLRACEMLMEADKKFKQEQAKKSAAEAVKQAQDKTEK